MKAGILPSALRLTEEEAFALLNLAMTSPQKLDAASATAIRKLAAYCSSLDSHHQEPAHSEYGTAV